jgi:integrase/recombinase XerD
MTRADAGTQARAHRAVPHLVVNRDGYQCLRLPNAIAEKLGLPKIQSLGTKDVAEARRLMQLRAAQVYRALGDEDAARNVRREIAPIGVRDCVSRFLRAFADGECPPRPSPKTLSDMYIPGLLGKKRAFTDFAERAGVISSLQIDRRLVERWLDHLRVEGQSADTIRIRLQCVRRLVQFAAAQGYVSEAAAESVRAIKAPLGVKGRARADGVPTMREIEIVLTAMTPEKWRVIAEAQLRLGLRRGEVLALQADWIEDARGAVRVRISSDFTTKDREERVINADPATLEIARQAAMVVEQEQPTPVGYRMAWRRALERAREQGVDWKYRAKTHALRQAFAMESVAAGMPLRLLADQLGHSTVRVTEAHYLARFAEAAPILPFAGVARLVAPPRPKVRRSRKRTEPAEGAHE